MTKVDSPFAPAAAVLVDWALALAIQMSSRAVAVVAAVAVAEMVVPLAAKAPRLERFVVKVQLSLGPGLDCCAAVAHWQRM